MQIVVNTRLLLKDKLDGIGWFSYQTLKHMTQQNPDVHFVFLFDREYDEQFMFSDNITPLVIGPQARHPFLYYAWFHVSVKHLLNRSGFIRWMEAICALPPAAPGKRPMR